MSIWERYQKSIAQGCLTNSKHPRSHVNGIYPKVFKHVLGNRLVDECGVGYIDYICGLGSNFTGERYSFEGLSPSFPTELEIRAAEKVKDFFPFIEKLKFLKTGTEACAAAIRIARAHTGRERVLSEGYHGWSDDFVALTEPAAGVPRPRSWIEKFTENALVMPLLENVAAVIVEPVITDWSKERANWLRELRQKCTAAGAVLIFDEVITGLRFKSHSVAKHFGIYPDIICLGKALGGGYPLSIVGGKAEIMDNPHYFVSSTFAGEHAALNGWLATAQFLKRHKVEELWEDGQQFIDRFNECPFSVKIQGYPTRGVFTGEQMQKALFFQEAAKSGILFGPSWFFNFKHAPETDSTIGICSDIANRIARGEVKFEGEMPASPFAERVRKNVN